MTGAERRLERRGSGPGAITLLGLALATLSFDGRDAGHTAAENPPADSRVLKDQTLASSDKGLVLLWNAGTGELQRKLEGRSDTVVGVAYTPDSDDARLILKKADEAVARPANAR